MKLFWKRSLAMLLVVLMVMTVAPATVFATGETETTTEESTTTSPEATPASDETEAEVKIEVTDAEGNVTRYPGFTGFKDLNLNGCTIKLLGNVSDANLILNKNDDNVVLDLNGFTFSRTGSSSGAISLSSTGKLTIRDTSEAKTGKVIADTYAIWILNGDLVLEGGTIQSTSTKNPAIYANASSTEVNGGKVVSAGDAILVGDNFVESRGVSVVEIKGGEIVAEGRGIVSGSYAQDATCVAITGGTIDSEGDSISFTKGEVTVTGGEFSNIAPEYVENGATVTVGGKEMTKTESGEMVEVVAPVPAVAQIGTQGYATLADALAAAATMTGDVTVEIFDKVTLAAPINGSFDSITFVGKDTDAEIYLEVQGYITATGKKVAFENLKLSKSVGGYVANAGFMNVAFGIYDVTEVTYTDCTFANGAYAASGKVTYTGCTFKRSHDKYGLWAYGDVDVTVNGGVFDNDRGIKMYAEGATKTTDLTVKGADFSKLTGKPAIVLTSGESVTLKGNTYSSTGVFELDLDGVPNGTPITSTDPITCVNDNGACGVIVDGKIYTTVAQAAAVATSGSTVTLLHNSAETVELAEGVSLNKNGFEAAGVTVKTPVYVAEVNGEKFESVLEALDYAIGTGASELKLLADSREVMPTDIEIVIKANLKITADAPVSAKFYNNGTSYDFIINSNNNNTFTIGENVTFQLEDRVIWAGYYGNNVDVVIEGTLAGYQYWHGADTTVTSTGTLKTTGEALVMRRGATLNVYGGKVEASYFNILAGNIFAENGADIKCGAFWIANTGSYAGEGAVSVNISDSTLTSSGNLKSASTHAAGVSIDIYDSTVTFADFDGYGASVLDANTTLWVNGESSELTVKSLVNNGTVEIYDAGSMIATGTVTNNNVFTVESGSSFEGNYVNNAKVYVAEVNGTKYESLQEAIAAAQTGDTVTLLADIELTETVTVPAGKTIVLDLNGKTVTGRDDVTYGDLAVAGTASLTITDSSTSANGKFDGVLLNYGTLTIAGGTVTSDSNTKGIGGTIVCQPDDQGNLPKLNITGGTVSYTGNATLGMAISAYATNGRVSELNISGGTITSTGVCVMAEATGSITGGTFTGKNLTDIVLENITLSGGAAISGGTFNTDVSKYLAEGYELKTNDDGTYGVAVDPAYGKVAMIGENYYATLEEALAAAQAGDEIVLLADATPALKSQRAITKAAVIDLNGKTLTLTEDDLYFGTTTFKNGTIVVDPSVKPSTAVFWMFANQTLTFDNVKLVATGVSGTYLIGLDGDNSDLNLLNGSEIVVENTTALDLDIICVNASTGNDIVIENSKVNVTNLDGRVFFRGNYTISGTSEITLTGITKAGFRIEAGQTLSIEDTSKVTIVGKPRDGGIHLTDFTATYTKADTATVNATVNKPAVATVNGVGYATLEEAFKAATAGCEIEILADVVIDYKWDVRYTGAKFTVPVTIDGNGHKITFTGVVNDGYNYYSAFRFEADATVKNLTVDMSRAVSEFQGRFRAISAKANLTVENCTFIGNGSANNTRAIIFGEGGTAESLANVTITITKSNFNGWRQAIGDNESGKTEVKTVVITGNKMTDAGVNVSAYDSITFTDNTVADKHVKLVTYAANNTLTVTATGNTLAANGSDQNYTNAKTANVQAGFVTPPRGSNSFAYTTNENGYVKVWGEGGGNASESFVLKLYSGTTLIATTELNNVDGIIDGDVYVTWNFFYPSSTDPYWTTTWEEGHPRSNAQPTHVDLIIDGVVVATTDAKMSGADGINPVIWKDLGGVKYIVEALAGTGSKTDPFIISNVEELLWFQAKVDEQAADGSTQFAGKYFKLTADIDLAGIKWNPIGSKTGDHASFKGIFDGDGHTISNLYIEQAGEGLGLFAYTSGNAVIKNLNLVNVTVKSTNNSNYVGGLIGNAYASTKVENVHISGNVYISGRGYVGGIAGHGYVVMDNVSVIANEGGLITSTFWCAGGILGYAGEGLTNITNARVEGLTITSAAGGLGAIVGMAEDNDGTQPISGSNLSAKNVEIKTYVGGYGTAYEDYAMGYLYGGSEISKLTGNLTVENVSVKTASGNDATVGDAVAIANGKVFFNLQAAINEGGEIKLLKDVKISETIIVAKNITLDGNGKTLTSTAGRAINVSGADGVTIKNLTIDAKGERAINIIQNATNVTIDNVTATAANYTVNVAASAPNAVVAIKNSTLNGLCTVNVASAGAKVTVDNSTVNCNDNNTTAGESYAALCLNKDAVGASIIATNTTVNVTAGSDSTKGRNGAENGTVTINGSTEGVTVTVAVITYPGSDYYYGFTSLADAIAAAKAGDTITLIRDVTLSEILTINKAITLDGNYKTLTSTAARAINVSGADGVKIMNLTINASGERAINVIDGATNVTIDNVTATAANYAVNVAGSATNAVVAITNSNLTGLNVVNVAAENAKVTVTGGTLTCNDQTDVESYAALALHPNAAGATITAAGVTFDIKGDSSKAGNGTTDGTITIDGVVVGQKVAMIQYADGTAYIFDSLADAIAKAQNGETVVLLRDVTINELIKIEKEITIDLNRYKVTATSQKAFEVYANATIENGTIEAAQRCVDTRKAVELTLTDVKLIADKYTSHGNPQPLTIGGSENGTKVTMTNVTISAKAGYGIITFVKTELTATGSTIGGYNALYVKPGSDNSTFNFVDCDLSGSTAGNDVEDNSFSTIAVRANDVTVDVDADSTITATGNYCWAISMDSKFTGETGSTGAKITIAGTINGKVVTSIDASKSTVTLKAEYADEVTADGYAYVTNNDGTITLAKAVAKIGDTYYATLEAAIAVGGKVTLLADVTINETIEIVAGNTVELDLNGYTINAGWDSEANAKHIYVFHNYGTFTITGEGVINTRGIFNYGTMTLENGTINAIDCNGGYAVRNYAGTFTMNGGTIATTYEDGDIPGNGYDACPVRVDEGAEFIMNDGTINNVSNYTVAIDNYGTTTINGGVFTTIHTTIANSGTMTINGGTFTCNGLEGVTAHAVWADEGTLTINGGTFNGKDNYNGFNVDASKGAVVCIKGGNFLSVHSGSLYGEGVIEVSGGTFFDAVPEIRCAEGYVPTQNADGTYGVRKANYVARVDGVGYENITEAINAAMAQGKSVVLESDIKVDMLVVNPGVTFDLNGYIVESSFVAAFGNIVDNGETTGGIKVASSNSIILQPTNTYMPLYDAQEGCYRFYAYTTKTAVAGATTTSVRFAAAIFFEKADAYELLATEANGGMSIKFNITWEGSSKTIVYSFSSEKVAEYANAAYDLAINGKPVKKAFFLTLNGIDSLESGTKITTEVAFVTTTNASAQNVDVQTHTVQ